MGTDKRVTDTLPTQMPRIREMGTDKRVTNTRVTVQRVTNAKVTDAIIIERAREIEEEQTLAFTMKGHINEWINK